MAVIVRPPVTIHGQVEITRSFSFKLNMERYGGNRFESRDFFCSQKAACNPDEADEIAIMLHSFCKRIVLRDVHDYTRECEKELARREGKRQLA